MIRRILKAIKEFSPPTSNCEVVGCARTEAEPTEVLALDPIDHDDKTLQLCPKHQVWADERNIFAEDIREEFREYRKDLGQERLEEVQRLAHPQDGHLREDILIGETGEDKIPLGEATEESQSALGGSTKMSELLGENE